MVSPFIHLLPTHVHVAFTLLSRSNRCDDDDDFSQTKNVFERKKKKLRSRDTTSSLFDVRRQIILVIPDN